MLTLLPLARRNSHRRRKPRPSHKLPKPPQLLPIEEVMLRSGVGRSALYGRIKAGTFPAPAKVGSSSRWFSTEVDEWVHAAMATRPAMTA